jgi:mannose-1-phosphate guanylyltransferase
MPSKYALILAGGAGTRLWPLSRKDRPKPLLPLVDVNRSMFQITVERLYPLFSPDEILVVANEELTQKLREQAPDLPSNNFIVEPVGRNSVPCCRFRCNSCPAARSRRCDGCPNCRSLHQ